jgi:hypothetical protein
MFSTGGVGAVDMKKRKRKQLDEEGKLRRRV